MALEGGRPPTRGHEEESSLRTSQPSHAAPGWRGRRTRSSCTARCALTRRSSRSSWRAAGVGDIDPPSHPGAPFSVVGSDPNSTSSTPTRTRSTSSTRPTATRASTRCTSPGLPAHLQAGRRALPAHALHRLRHAHARPADAARRTDRLHAARVPADLPPRRPAGADDERVGVPPRPRRGAATSASRTGRRSTSSCASA